MYYDDYYCSIEVNLSTGKLKCIYPENDTPYSNDESSESNSEYYCPECGTEITKNQHESQTGMCSPCAERALEEELENFE